MISIKVPGKVMLSGEYAVLYGGTAVLVPAPFYLKLVETKSAPDKKYSPIVTEASSYNIPEISEYENEHGKPYVELDADEFFSKDIDGNLQKLGIGLSAAEAVGVVALRFERAGLSWDGNRFKIAAYADKIHRKVQGGIGSGADIAACAYAQPIKFRRIDDQLDIEPINPEEFGISIPLNIIWTGIPANTRTLVGDFQKWLNNGGVSTKKLLDRLIESGNNLADQWFVQNQSSLCESLDSFIDILDEIAVSAGLSFMLPIHSEIANLAKNTGGRAKSTGAGGGDMILLIGDVSIDKIKYKVIPLQF